MEGFLAGRQEALNGSPGRARVAREHGNKHVSEAGRAANGEDAKKRATQAHGEVIWTKRVRRRDHDRVNIEDFRQGGVRLYERTGSPDERAAGLPLPRPPSQEAVQRVKLFSANTDRVRRLEALSASLGTSGKALSDARILSAGRHHATFDGAAAAAFQARVSAGEQTHLDSLPPLSGSLQPLPPLPDAAHPLPPAGDVAKSARSVTSTAPADRAGAPVDAADDHSPHTHARGMSAADMMSVAQTLALRKATQVAFSPGPPGDRNARPPNAAGRGAAAVAGQGRRAQPNLQGHLDIREVGIEEPEGLPVGQLGLPLSERAREAGPPRGEQVYMAPRQSASRGRMREEAMAASIEIHAPETGKVLRELQDVLDYYLSHGSQAAIKIFYLNPSNYPGDRSYDPYDAWLVDQAHVAPQHFTVTVQGVVRVLETGESQFTSLGEFIRERSTFKMIKSIRFFKEYFCRKYFGIWRAMVRWSLFRRTRQRLAQRLFLVKPVFQDTIDALMEARTAVEETRVLVGDYEDVHGESPKLYSVADFLEANNRQREDAMEYIREISNRVGHALEATGDHIAEQEGRARDQVEIDQRSLRKEEKLSISQAKAQRQERHRKHLQTKADVALMPRLIKLADLVLMENTVRCVLGSVSAMHRLLRSQEWRSGSVYKGVFETKVEIVDNRVAIVPDEDQINYAVEQVLGAVMMALESMPRVYGASGYKYLNRFFPDEDPRAAIDPTHIVLETDAWIACREGMGAVVRHSFAVAREQTQVLETKLEMHRFIKQMEREGDRVIHAILHPQGSPDPEALALQMRKIKIWVRGMDAVKKLLICGALSVDLREIKEYMVVQAQAIYRSMQRALHEIGTMMVRDVSTSLQERLERLQVRPKALAAFVAFHNDFNDCVASRNDIRAQVDAVEDVYELILLSGDEKDVLSFEDDVMRKAMHDLHAQIADELDHAEAYLSSQRASMVAELDMKLMQLDAQLLSIVTELNTGRYSNPDEDAREVAEALEKLDEQLVRLSATSQEYHVYGMVLTPGMARDDQNLEQAARDLEMRRRIWDWMRLFRNKRLEWQLSPVTSLHLDDIQDNLDELVREAYKMTKLYKDDAVATLLAQEIHEFQDTQPLLELAANKALQNRHWEKIFHIIGRQLPVDEEGERSVKGLSLDDLRKLGLGNPDVLKKADQIQAVAVKEAGVQQALKRMQTELQERELTVLRYKDKEGAYKLGSVDEILTLLDEQVMTVQTIVASPFSTSFKPDARRWEKHLLILQDLIDTWIKVQGKWLYLEPIFQSQDIGAQLPDTTTQFLSVDTAFQVMMHDAHDDPRVVFAPANTARNQEMLEQLQRSLGTLETVHKALSTYLDAKRLLFPRFFFLSDDEMLEVLSEVRDPTRVEPHLRKSFEGIAKLRFEGKVRDPLITGMVSAEGEFVPFVTNVFPRDAGGNVEKWLSRVESSMFEATKVVTSKCMAEFPGGRQVAWMLKWPQMSVLAVSALFWTRAVEEAIESHALEDLVMQCQDDIVQVVERVRGDLDPLSRLTLSTLLVHDVHARDVAQHLVGTAVRDLADFEWKSQLRTYYEPAQSASRWGSLGRKKLAEFRGDARTPKAPSDAGHDDARTPATPSVRSISRRPSAVVRSVSKHFRQTASTHPATPGVDAEVAQDGMAICLRMMDARIEFGYEYLGNSTRLVVTPLTDRCYRTLVMAYQLTLGGAPEGPAGTGKTETTKDLAKTVAKHCLVFNCSEELDELSLGKFFKGLCATGAWACFDEFNRINLEVLSVAAQQIATIQMAIASRVFTLEFEGTTLQLKHTAWVGVTMNPSYAGRNELPDNLKGRFRAMAMMVPDYAMIAETMLFSEGYVAANKCAQKIVQCYKLCSEQLSSQDHYDYGMRAVIAVLRAAGILKRRFPKDDEYKLILRSLLDVNLCKFVAEDIPLFQGIVADLFPDSKPLVSDYSNLRWALRETCIAIGLQPSPYFLTKCIQLQEMVAVRHGLMLVGRPLSGKSTAFRTLAQALTMLAEHGQEDCHPVHYHVINPKAMPIGRLFGKFDINTHEWQDGVLAMTFREASRRHPESEDREWIVLDGPVDAMWIENLNTVLDDNKKLCLNSGEIIRMSPGMTMIFEVMDLSRASPATISRCGMVYTDPETLGWQPMVLSWLERLGDHMDGLTDAHKALLLGLINNYVPVTLQFISREVRSFVPVSHCAVVKSFMLVFDAISAFMCDAHWWDRHARGADIHLQHLFVHALLWSVGSVCASDADRHVFSTFFRALVHSELRHFKSPSGAVYSDGMESGNLMDWRSVLVPMMQGEQGHGVSALLRGASVSPAMQAQRSLAASPSRGMDMLNTTEFRESHGSRGAVRRSGSRLGDLRRDLGGSISVPLSRQTSRNDIPAVAVNETSEGALSSHPSATQLWKAVGRKVGVGQREAEVALRRQSVMMAGGVDDAATVMARKELAKDMNRHINLIVAEEVVRDALETNRRRVQRSITEEGQNPARLTSVVSRSLSRRGLYPGPVIDSIAEEGPGPGGVAEESSGVLLSQTSLFEEEGSMQPAEQGYSAAEEAWLALLGMPQALGFKLTVDTIPRTSTDRTVFDWHYVPKTIDWRQYSKEEFDMPAGVGPTFRDVVIPTPEHAQYIAVLDLCVPKSLPVLFVGPTGVGKSTYILQHLAQLDTERYTPTNHLVFTARTTAEKAQAVIEAKLDRRRRGVLGPPLGKTMVVFVDDLNMPRPEEYGAQPPIELLRTVLDQGGVFGTDRQFYQISDCSFVAAMGPTGGGRHAVTERLLRHFVTVTMVDLPPSTMQFIFEAKLNIHMANEEAPPELLALSGQAVSATLRVYEASVQRLMPTPQKSHYLFSARDVARVVEGMTLPDYDEMDVPCMTRLWAHECMRVFGDRLIEDGDLDWLQDKVLQVMQDTLQTSPEFAFTSYLVAGVPSTKEALKTMSFSDLTTELRSGGNIGIERAKPYGEAPSTATAVEAAAQGLKEYHTVNRKPLRISVFWYVVQHMARVLRVLRLPGEHAMLVGMGGTGRQSLTRLAAFMAHCTLVEVHAGRLYSMEDWKEDVKRAMTLAGCQGKPTVFLFSEQQVRFEEQVEHISSLIQSGDVPSLFTAEEKGQMVDAMRANMEQAADAVGRNSSQNTARMVASMEGGADLSNLEMWSMFVSRVRRNLHTVLCMSPDHDAFRERLRQFPALVNCCTIDWFQDWPDEALQAVAEFELAGFAGLESRGGEGTEARVIRVCKRIHLDTRLMGAELRRQRGRYSTVTPKVFLSLFTSIKKLVGSRGAHLSTMHQRFLDGLAQLESAQSQVADLQLELTMLKPKLEDATEQARRKLVEVAAEQAKVEEYKRQVDEELARANETAEAANRIRLECEARLQDALPAMEAAIKSLDTIDSKDMRIVQSFKSPPEPIKLVLQAVMALLRIDPLVLPDPNEYGKKLVDFWTPALRMLQDQHLLDRLKKYDKDNIDAKIMERVRREYISREDFKTERVRVASEAMAGICKWVVALSGYDTVAKEIAPKRQDLAKADEEYRQTMEVVHAKQEELEKLLAQLARLKEQAQQLEKRKAELGKEIDTCGLKISRAERLVVGLGDEKLRWAGEAEVIQGWLDCIVGDMVLCAGVITYLGPFPKDFRDEALTRWEREVVEAGLRYSRPTKGGFSVVSHLGDPVQILGWHLDGLPNDALSVENAIITHWAVRAPLLVDPVGQATKWLTNMFKKSSLQQIKSHDKDLLRKIENAVQFGLPVIITEVTETIDPALDPVLGRQIFTHQGVVYVHMGDANIEWNDKFSLYLSSPLGNPRLLPDTAAKVTMVNFAITEEGLGDQLLGVMLAEERPELALEHKELTLQRAANAKKLQELENEILRVVSTDHRGVAGTGSILDDEAAITIVQESKRLSLEVKEKNRGIEAAQERLEEARRLFHKVGLYAAMLFFCTQDLNALDPMYVFSLDWFVGLFVASIKRAPASHDVPRRLAAISAELLWTVFENVCMGLFARDKLTFTTLVAVRLKQRDPGPAAGSVPEQVRFLLSGGQSTARHPREASPPAWMAQSTWFRVCRLAAVHPRLHGLPEAVYNALPPARAAIDDMDESCAGLPRGSLEEGPQLDAWDRLLVVRALRPDLTVRAARAFVSETLGARFTEPPPLDMEQVFAHSTSTRPMIFLLAPGLDPIQAIWQYAERVGMRKSVVSVSLGRGQGPKAERVLGPAVRDGDWVVLQNAHLAPSWLPWLERFLRNLSPEETNRQFRLLITSMPTGDMPLYLLREAIKVCNEPQQGMKANMLRCLNMDAMRQRGLWPEADEDPASVRHQSFARFVYALSFLHAVVKERGGYGPAGWSVPYSFSDGDFTISLTQLRNLLMQAAPGQEHPLKAIKYIVGEINYGGRVTDDKDRRLMATLLESIFTTDLASLQPAPLIDPAGPFVPPGGFALEDLHAAVHGLPPTASPECLGLHRNADIAKDLQEATALLEDLADAVTGSAVRKQADMRVEEQLVHQICADMASRLPQDLDAARAADKYPPDYNQSMNQVVNQEVVRYNRLLREIRSSLHELQRAIDGVVVMTRELDDVFKSFVVGAVPAAWLAKSYPSLKPLGSYFDLLLMRIHEFQRWIDTHPPAIYWLSGFFFTHSFLTAIRQNYARKHRIPIDTVAYAYEMQGMWEPLLEDRTRRPVDGALVRGMYLEGAAWDLESGTLVEARPRELFTPAPMVLLRPTRGFEPNAIGAYECPLYRTTERRGQLTTTGHSTNYVISISMPTTLDPSHWVMRGTCLTLERDD